MLLVGLLFCFLIGLIPCRIQKGSLKSLLFWGINNILVTAVLKVLIGESHFTLIESFDDIGMYTFLHYLVPFVAMDLLGVYLGKYIWKDNFELFQSHYLSGLVVCFVSFFVLFFRIENMMLVIATGFSFVFSCVLTIKNYREFSKSHYENNIKKLLPYLGVYIVTAVIFVPTEFVVYNYTDLHITLGDLFIAQMLVIAILVFIICFGLFFLNDVHLKITMMLFLLVGICGYIQGNFLNGKLEVLDGRKPQEWTMGSCITNFLIWTLLFVLVFLLYQRREKWLTYLCVYLCAVQIVSIAYILITVERPEMKGNYELTSEEFMVVGNEKNVVVFVLDWFDEQILEKIVDESPDFMDPLHDFCWYQNCTSKYAFTDMSLPYLLTGVEWEKGMTEAEYSRYAHENGTLLPAIHEMNFGIGIYTDTYNAFNLPEKWIDNASTTVETSKNRMKISAILQKSCMYKLAPFALKPFYRYDGNAFVASISTGTHNNLYFADRRGQEVINDDLNNEKLQILDEPNYFKFIHLNGAHPDFYYDENMEYSPDATDISQGKATLKIVYKFIDQLRECGLYDNATILITADHGQNYLNNEGLMKECGYRATSSPILLVKLARQVSENMAISNAPVSHEQMVPTILSEIGIADIGRTFQEISEEESVVRDMTYVRHPDITYTRYIIEGDVRNVNSWRTEEVTE